jgi:hypothetical protein
MVRQSREVDKEKQQQNGGRSRGIQSAAEGLRDFIEGD